MTFENNDSGRTFADLKKLQQMPLQHKIIMTRARIRQWISIYGVDGVYVSFSGGKDSTVLLDIVRRDYPDVPAVFVDTGLEYPEIREYVRDFTNVTWLKPKKNFRQVIQDYGYPFISKEVSQTVYEVRRSVANGKPGATYRLKKLNGEAIDKNTGQLSTYNIPQWKFMLNAPFAISHMCCNTMKKQPAKLYEKQTGRKPITAQMASESRLRKEQWIKHGCNAFDKKRQISNPMSFWTEQDVLTYIKLNNIKIAPVYGEIKAIYKDDITQIDGQMNIADFDEFKVFDLEIPELTTTKCKRTGCMFCGFGCHREKPGEGRFERLKITHPKIYDYIMRPWDQGGLDYQNVIDWINENNGKGEIIRY